MAEEKKLSRRTFIKGAGFGAAGMLGAGVLAACAPPSSGDSGGDANVSEDTAAGVLGNRDNIGALREAASTEETDVVIIGSGMAGHTAAIFLKEQHPDAKVILLEKQSGLGGNTNFAEILMVGPNFDETVARQEAFAASKVRDYIPSPQLWYSKFRSQGDASVWLFGKHGVKAEPTGFFEGGNGASAIKTLTPQAESLGVEIRTNSRATALVLADEYTVTGIQYLDAGGEYQQINAKAVILATAGLGNNPDLLDQYMEPDGCKVVAVGLGQDGDGQLMVERTPHGRAKYSVLDAMVIGIGTLEEPTDFDSDLSLAAGHQPTAVYVNNYGSRYMSENVMGPGELTGRGVMMLSQPKSYTIFDASYIERWENGEWTMSRFAADPADGRPMQIQSDLEKYADATWLYKADTVQALGEAIAKDTPEFDVAAFVKQVEDYTKYAENGKDEVFDKPAGALWPLNKGPFYAAQTCLRAFATHGGIRVNTNSQVIDPLGKVIDGLFAAGACTAGWDCMRYQVGAGQPMALWGGLAAARYIIENKLGGSIAADWMGDVPIEDFLQPGRFTVTAGF